MIAARWKPRRFKQKFATLCSVLNPPEIVLLLRLLLMSFAVGRNRGTERITIGSDGERFFRIYHWSTHDGGIGGVDDWLNQRRSCHGGLVRIADQLEQVMILDVFNLVGQADETAVYVVERAAVELIAELLAAHRQGMASGVFAEDQLGIGDTN